MEKLSFEGLPTDKPYGVKAFKTCEKDVGMKEGAMWESLYANSQASLAAGCHEINTKPVTFLSSYMAHNRRVERKPIYYQMSASLKCV